MARRIARSRLASNSAEPRYYAGYPWALKLLIGLTQA